MRVMVTGAAPISPSVLKFLRAALGCQVINTLILCVCVCVVCIQISMTRSLDIEMYYKMVVDFQGLWYMLFSCKHAHLVKITTLKVN